ncbi:MAG: hypothetical protein ACREOU_06225 [Candidatus Eiseniibacteriota bacterium]
MNAWCQRCGSALDNKPGDVVGRAETCPNCRADLHACVQCVHYDPRAYNQCREPQAERVDDRMKANFCEFLKLKTTRPGVPGAQASADRASQARSKLDSLFRKPSESD